jgi:hypothetical protein
MNYFPVGRNKKIKVAGEKVNLSDLEFWKVAETDLQLSAPSYTTMNSTTLVYRGYIHFFCKTDSTVQLKVFDHLNGAWKTIEPVPFDLSYTNYTIFNNEIHAINSQNSPAFHYKWDGTAWTQLDAPPHTNYTGVVATLSDGIHLISHNDTCHYKWDGTTWTELDASGLSGWFNNSRYANAVTLDDEIYLFGYGSGVAKKFAKWDGEKWVELEVYPPTLSLVFPGDDGIYLVDRNAEKIYIGKKSGSSIIWTLYKSEIAAYDLGAFFRGKVHLFGNSGHKRYNTEQYLLVVNQP